MSIKGWQSRFMGITSIWASAVYTVEQAFVTISRIGYDKIALDVTTKQLALVSSGHTLDATGHVDGRILKDTGHSLSIGQVIKFSSGPNLYVEATVEKVLDANHVF